MKRHANLSIFVPHVGCPHRCVFCDQNAITSRARAPEASEVRALCEEFLPPVGPDTEIAFFGGSFTAVDRDYMTSLLEAAAPFVRAGRAAGIRLSTRPDAIDGEVLSVLGRYGVSAVELGAQSMDDAVLLANERGHTAGDVARASRLIRQAGFSLGLQMMVGMAGEKDPVAGAFATAQALLALQPDTVRIYPTLVLRGTRLSERWRAGDYQPLGVDEAADLCAELIPLFEEQGVRVIRVGLHSDQGMSEAVEAGPFHPAFGELCYGRVVRRRIEALVGQGPRATVWVHPSRLSRARGHKKENIATFRERGILVDIRPDDTLGPEEIRVQG